VAFEHIRETCQPSHIDATIRVEIALNTFKIEPNESLEEFIRRFNELHARLKTPLCDEVRIRHIIRAMGANKKVKNDYDLEIRNMMSNNADLTFDKFVEGLLRRMEAIKYSNLDSGNGVEEEVNAVNFRFGSDRGRSRGRGRGHSHGRGSGRRHLSGRGRGRFSNHSHPGRRGGSSLNNHFPSHPPFMSSNPQYPPSHGHPFSHSHSQQAHYVATPYAPPPTEYYPHYYPTSSLPPPPPPPPLPYVNTFHQPHRPTIEQPAKRTRFESASLAQENEVVIFSKNESFIIDSGCSSHMCGNLDLFDTYTMLDQEVLVELANGLVTEVKARGRVGPFTEVYYVPELTKNLISVSQLDRVGYSIIFQEGEVLLTKKGANEQPFRLGVLRGKLYYLEPTVEFAGTMVERRKDIQLWHQRLAHLNHRDVIELSNSDVVEGMNVTSKKTVKCDA
jgi:hypothetical protein